MTPYPPPLFSKGFPQKPLLSMITNTLLMLSENTQLVKVVYILLFYLKSSWLCFLSTEHHRMRLVCENERMRLTCKNETVLAIYSATFGHLATYQKCLRVSRRCHGRANCSVLADTKTFGDPCFPGTRKHLRVSFTCGKLWTRFYQWKQCSLQVDGSFYDLGLHSR
uniref:Si:ch73-335m24.2 n=1 Tax=Oryzias sinensis TaxID=183150 RepID=A0A8C8E1R2_9TELE